MNLDSWQTITIIHTCRICLHPFQKKYTVLNGITLKILLLSICINKTTSTGERVKKITTKHRSCNALAKHVKYMAYRDGGPDDSKCSSTGDNPDAMHVASARTFTDSPRHDSFLWKSRIDLLELYIFYLFCLLFVQFKWLIGRGRGME